MDIGKEKEEGRDLRLEYWKKRIVCELCEQEDTFVKYVQIWSVHSCLP